MNLGVVTPLILGGAYLWNKNQGEVDDAKAAAARARKQSELRADTLRRQQQGAAARLEEAVALKAQLEAQRAGLSAQSQDMLYRSEVEAAEYRRNMTYLGVGAAAIIAGLMLARR
jgi:hypothetical protein